MLSSAKKKYLLKIAYKKNGLFFLQLLPAGRRLRNAMMKLYVSRKILRKSIMQLQNNRCIHCGEQFVFLRNGHPHAKLGPTLDHVLPRSAGGWDGAGNFIVLHTKCNQEKDNNLANGCELIWAMANGAQLGHLILKEGFGY